MRFGRRLAPRFWPPLAIVVVVAAAAVAAGCTIGAGTNGSNGKLTVVTTTTVLADIASNVGGDLVSVTSLVPKNADVHTFEPRPFDVRTVASAKLLVMNGLGLDDWRPPTARLLSGSARTCRA